MTKFKHKPEPSFEELIETINNEVTEVEQNYFGTSDNRSFQEGYILGSAYHAPNAVVREAWLVTLQRRFGYDDEFIATTVIGG